MMDRKKCKKCKYRGYINGVPICQYILVTRKRRKCYEGKCDKYEKGDQEECVC